MESDTEEALRRVEIDDTLPMVVLPSRILNELRAHAQESGQVHPGQEHGEECCGLLVGDDEERFRRSVRCRNEMTQRHQADRLNYPRDGRAGYYMSEREYLQVSEEAEAAGQGITAVYHSHIGAGAYLSELDLEYAENEFFPFPNAVQIVLGVADGVVREAGFFEREAPGKPFSGRPIKLMGS